MDNNFLSGARDPFMSTGLDVPKLDPMDQELPDIRDFLDNLVDVTCPTSLERVWVNGFIPGFTSDLIKCVGCPMTRHENLIGIKEIPESIRSELKNSNSSTGFTNGALLSNFLKWQREVLELMKLTKSQYEENLELKNKIKKQEQRIAELESGAGPVKKARIN